MNKKILIGLGHPAHFHLFKGTIQFMLKKNTDFKIVITDKDILAKLLDEHNIKYERLWSRRENEKLWHKALKIVRTTILLRKIVSSYNPDFMLGTLSQLAYVGKLTKIPFYFFGEDDITYTYLQCYITYPFVTNMIAPTCTNVGLFKYKKIEYNGYQKLAYLHPNHFTPDQSLIPEIDITEKYAIIRLVDLNAYHDINVGGINNKFLDKLISELTKTTRVYISSENKIPTHLEQYKLPIKVQYIHHALAYANLFIGDSQSMTVEAAILGVPALKFNDFKGKISVLNELEFKYGLTFGYSTDEQSKLIEKVTELSESNNLKNEFAQKRLMMLNEKIDVTAFFCDFIENKLNI